MTKQIKIDESFVKEIADAHHSYQSQQDVLTSLINQHVTDKTDVFIESAVYLKLSQRCAEALQKFETLKAVVEPTYIPAEKGYLPNDWSLDYSSNTLTINYREA